MRNAWLLLAMLLLTAGIAPSQETENQPSDRGTLEGRVVNIQNGRVVPRATVVVRNLRRMSDARSVRCDGQGHFLVKNVEAGSYRLSAERQGYFSGTRHQVFQYRIDLDTGEHRDKIVLSLQPAAVVTGQVRDENSDPMQHVRVQLLDRIYRSGHVELQPAGTAVTDDRGIYRISDVHPGNYYIVAVVQPASPERLMPEASLRNTETPPESDIAYFPVIFPDASDFPHAQTLPVLAGEEAQANFAFASKPSVLIRGRVVNGITGEPGPNSSVKALWTDYMATDGVTGNGDKDGNFELHGLAPGVYSLRASFAIEGVSYSIQRRIEVGPAGLENVELDAVPDTAISGVVRTEVTNQEQQLPRHVNVELQSNTSPAHSSAVATLPPGAPPGSAVLAFQTRLHPGEPYTVSTRGLPGNDYLKSVIVNGHTVEPDQVSVSDQRADVELLISPSGGYVEGLVLDEAGQVFSGATVVLVPEDSNLDQPNLFRTATTDRKGTFRIRAIVPGSYQLLAFDDVDMNELIGQPEVLKRFEDRAVAINIEEQMDYSTALKVIHGSEETRPPEPQ